MFMRKEESFVKKVCERCGLTKARHVAEKCPKNQPTDENPDNFLNILPFQQIGEELRKDVCLNGNEQLTRKWDHFLTNHKQDPVVDVKLFKSYIDECERQTRLMYQPMQLNGGFFDSRNRLAPIPITEEMKAEAAFKRKLLQLRQEPPKCRKRKPKQIKVDEKDMKEAASKKTD